MAVYVYILPSQYVMLLAFNTYILASYIAVDAAVSLLLKCTVAMFAPVTSKVIHLLFLYHTGERVVACLRIPVIMSS